RRWTGRERVIDVGSGAGFPGLALRIARPDLAVTLVESVGKKARFLEEVRAALGLAHVEVRNERAAALVRERRARYDVGTASVAGRSEATDPLALAKALVEQGAEELHLVDLDGAETGVLANAPLLASVAHAVGVPCRLAGGLSSLDEAREALERGFAGVLFSS